MLAHEKAKLSAEDISYQQAMIALITDFKKRSDRWFFSEESKATAFKALETFKLPGVIRFNITDMQDMLEGVATQELFLGYGIAGGEEANKKAVQVAITNALTHRELSTCAKLIFNVLGSENLGLDQIIAMSRYIMEYAPEGTEIVFGANIDCLLGDEISVFIIAK